MTEYYLDNKSFASSDDEDLLSLTAADGSFGAHRTVKSKPIKMTMMTNGTTSNNNNNNNNNNSQHYCIDDDGVGGTEDSTMEIPLLVDNTDDHEMFFNNCKCNQLGFAVNLKSKSERDAKVKIFFAIALCCLFMIIEFLGGYMAGSLAIMTDAAHLASDCVSFVIGLLAIWISSRAPDQNMSFGYKRIEVIGALVSILGIWILTAVLAIVACQRLFSDDFDLNADTMMIIAGIGILINIAMAFILHGSSLFPGSHGHSHHGHSHHGGGGGGGHHHSHSHAHPAAAADADATTQGHHHHSRLPGTDARGGVGNPLPADVSVSTSANIVKQQHVRNKPLPACGQEQNLNLRAAVIHVFGDLVQSVGVFVASIIIKFYLWIDSRTRPMCVFLDVIFLKVLLLYNIALAALLLPSEYVTEFLKKPNAKLADPLCTLLFSVIVIFTTVNLFKESVCILLDSVPKLVPLSKLQSDLSGISGVKSVHHLNVWNHTVNHSVMMVHLVVDILADSDAILTEATSLAHDKYRIQHSTIQIERV